MQTLDAIDNNDKSFFVIRGAGFQTLMKLPTKMGKGAKCSDRLLKVDWGHFRYGTVISQLIT